MPAYTSERPALDFTDLTPIEEEVKLPPPNNTKQYVLKECGAGGATQYRNAVIKFSRLSQDSSMFLPAEGHPDTDLLLISFCLYEREDNKPDKRVTVDFIKSLSLKIITPLFQRCREISGLIEDENTIDEIKKKMTRLTERLQELEKAKVDSVAGK